MIYFQLIGICWFAFLAYWAVSAIGVKKDTKQFGSWWRFLITRVLAALVIILIIRQWASSNSGKLVTLFIYNPLPIVSIAGVILCVLGISFAIWARAHLGRNWSGRPTTKVDHELVTSGPYRYVRHPIYTGIITALLGSALVTGLSAAIAFVMATLVFVRRITIEEKYMNQLFPNQYPQYKKTTKALFPFIF